MRCHVFAWHRTSPRYASAANLGDAQLLPRGASERRRVLGWASGLVASEASERLPAMWRGEREGPIGDPPGAPLQRSTSSYLFTFKSELLTRSWRRAMDGRRCAHGLWIPFRIVSLF